MELNIEQQEAAHFSKTGALVIKGTAGSGKTLVGLSRIPYLINNFCFEKEDNILLLTYTNTLVGYLKHLLKKHQLENHVINLKENIEDRIEISTVDKIMWNYGREFFKEKKYDVIFENDLPWEKILESVLLELKNDGKNISFFQDEKENFKFISDELNWIRESNVSSIEDYLSIERKGRGNAKKLYARERMMIFEILKIYRLKMKNQNMIDSFDFKKGAFLITKSGKEIKKYTHIIIDEAQDLSKIKLDFLLNILDETKSYSTITFLYDTAQSIYLQSWLGNGWPFNSLNVNIRGKVKKLARSFRTTRQIHKAAQSILDGDGEILKDSEYVEPEFFNEEGIKPFYSHFETFEKQIDYVVDLVNNLKEKYGYKEIIIATKQWGNCQKIVKRLEFKGIKAEELSKKNYNFSKDVIAVTTLHSIKGLESPVVILLDLNEGIIPGNYNGSYMTEEEERKDRKLLYVGMTRAQELLYVCSWGEKSRFLNFIEEETIIKLENNHLDQFDISLQEEVEKSQELLEKNRSDRYKELMKKIDDLEKTNKALTENNTQIINQLKESTNKIPDYFEFKKKIENDYSYLSKDAFESFATAEYLYNLDSTKNIDCSPIYLSYCKVIELELRDFLLKNGEHAHKYTFGKLISSAEKIRELKYFTKEIYRNNIIKYRNDCAHSQLWDKKICHDLRIFLIDNKNLSKLSTIFTKLNCNL